jgi:hypothetical protein
VSDRFVSPMFYAVARAPEKVAVLTRLFAMNFTSG